MYEGSNYYRARTRPTRRGQRSPARHCWRQQTVTGHIPSTEAPSAHSERVVYFCVTKPGPE